MSRIGNMPITVPAGVEVKIDGNHIAVKGPKGSLERDIHPNMKVELDGNEIKVSRPDDTNINKSLHGTTRALIHNMVEGVVHEFKVELEINGVGYRAQKKGNDLLMNLGYSHPVEMKAPQGVTFDLPDANHIVVRGIDKEVKTKHANKEAAKEVGTLIAKRAQDKKIKTVVFDRGGYLYHGIIKELAEAAREAGLEF